MKSMKKVMASMEVRILVCGDEKLAGQAGQSLPRKRQAQTTASSFGLVGLIMCSRLTPSHSAIGLATSTEE